MKKMSGEQKLASPFLAEQVAFSNKPQLLRNHVETSSFAIRICNRKLQSTSLDQYQPYFSNKFRNFWKKCNMDFFIFTLGEQVVTETETVGQYFSLRATRGNIVVPGWI